jgi:tRNA pseudouridine38-40 synthase
MRIAAGIEYLGTGYAGWQVQTHAPSIQAEVENALGRVADHPVRLACAGRTDAGVHAIGQVVHFDSVARRDATDWVFGANAHLPETICLRWAVTVADDFHARFSARSRRYRYLIHNSRTRSALYADRAAWCTYPLDVERMQLAARSLVGEHDFSSYRASACQARSPVRQVQEISLQRQGQWIVLEIEANAFLHHMVRNIAGVLMAVGRGIQDVAWPREILEARDRRMGGVTAEPHGLYFLLARYEACHGIPEPGVPAYLPMA